jgi:hypothetical protein
MSTLQFDIEDENWDPLPRDCDLVHLRLMLGSIQTSLWPDIYSKVLEYVSPVIWQVSSLTASATWLPAPAL